MPDRKRIKQPSNKMTILVSHSGKQYVHRFIEGLLTNNWRVIFCSPIWFQRLPAWLRLLPYPLRNKLAGELKKRFFAFHGNIELVTSPAIAWRKELCERIPGGLGINGAQLQLEKQQDIFAAGNVARHKPSLVVGYEITSMQTFREARVRDIITVLDLAQVHYSDILEIASRFPSMNYILKNPYLQEINERKQAEYESADFILTLSSYARQSLLKKGFPSDRVYEVNLGFDVNLFTPKRHYRKHGEFQVMICGTDMLRKGLGLLLQTLTELERRGLEIRLTIVGPRIEITKALEQFGSPMKISIHGFLCHEDLVVQYQQADLFVFPSYLDSWAMTVLEAMACGTPVIVTENTGSKDAVAHGGGIIIKTGNASALEEAIMRFYYDRSFLEETGKRAIEVAGGYTWENYYSKLGFALGDIARKSGVVL